MDFAQLIREFGLPVAILVGFALLIIRGDLQPRKSVERAEAESLYRDRLRAEERSDRLTAEKELERMAEVLASTAEAVGELAGIPAAIAALATEVKGLRADLRRQRPPS